jgi:single-strand DNA-binding protein
MSLFGKLSNITVRCFATTSRLFAEKGINQVTLVGRVGTDLKITVTPKQEIEGQERKVCVFSLGTNRYTGRNEEGKSTHNTDWHRIILFDQNLLSYAEKYVTKGDRLFINGFIRYNLVKDKNETERYITTIVAKEIMIVTKKGEKYEVEADSEADKILE